MNNECQYSIRELSRLNCQFYGCPLMGTSQRVHSLALSLRLSSVCVQFKQGVFDMGADVCPIAIKYNKIFVDAFWNVSHTNRDICVC